MKKTLLFFGLLLMLGTTASIATERHVDSGDDTKAVKIIGKNTKPSPDPKPRPKAPAIEAVECWVDAETGSIELQFNRPIGTATVTVTGDAGTVYSTTVDTAMTGMLVIPAPSQQGFYSITVCSPAFDGEGLFTI